MKISEEIQKEAERIANNLHSPETHWECSGWRDMQEETARQCLNYRKNQVP